MSRCSTHTAGVPANGAPAAPARGARARGEEGQAMVEFALVAPLLILILFAVIQFGVIFNDYIALTDATRAGARKAAVSRLETSPASIVEAKVRASATDLDMDKLDVDVTVDPAWAHGADVTVKATYEVPLPVGTLLGLDDITLTSQTTERVE